MHIFVISCYRGDVINPTFVGIVVFEEFHVIDWPDNALKSHEVNKSAIYDLKECFRAEKQAD